MIFHIKCESCDEYGNCCIRLAGDRVEAVILPRGWRAIMREPGGMHTHDAITFQCPRHSDESETNQRAW